MARMTTAKPPRKESTPAIPLFGDAYLSDTHHLSLEEHGAYLKLLMIAWRTADCSLPNDDKRLAMMLGISSKKWGQLKPVVMGFWRLQDSKWTQKRLTKERDYVEHKRAKNSDAAISRWESQPVENKGSGESERISKRKSERTSERISQPACENDAPPPPPLKTTDKSVFSAREHLLPEDWEPREFTKGRCKEIVDGWPRIDFERQVLLFRAHHTGHGNKWKDWQAAWQTWVLNSEKFDRGRASNGRVDPGSYDKDDLVAIIARENGLELPP